MSGEGTVLQLETANFPDRKTENERAETLLFEEIQTESLTVSEIETVNRGTRFARLKRVLRKRSASIL